MYVYMYIYIYIYTGSYRKSIYHMCIYTHMYIHTRILILIISGGMIFCSIFIVHFHVQFWCNPLWGCLNAAACWMVPGSWSEQWHCCSILSLRLLSAILHRQFHSSWPCDAPVFIDHFFAAWTNSSLASSFRSDFHGSWCNPSLWALFQCHMRPRDATEKTMKGASASAACACGSYLKPWEIPPTIHCIIIEHGGICTEKVVNIGV